MDMGSTRVQDGQGLRAQILGQKDKFPPCCIFKIVKVLSELLCAVLQPWIERWVQPGEVFSQSKNITGQTINIETEIAVTLLFISISSRHFDVYLCRQRPNIRI
ncbi:hypothetical protein ILYODFUR_016479 [Ilyodon furcidens]|uniref:Uncharacterized protein n=1 Tax=Ilyodon furcidens TaxID=33524 RepID=A0ABV0T082_9TELE